MTGFFKGNWLIGLAILGFEDSVWTYIVTSRFAAVLSGGIDPLLVPYPGPFIETKELSTAATRNRTE
jgi:hypothetical protein